MPRSVHVYLLPRLTTPEQLAGKTVVVVDVLRAGTTIIHALAAGAREVIPCMEVDEAESRAAGMGDRAVLGGERGGLPIEGFDLGNSPAEYVPETVGGRTVVFTTTNGTRAMARARKARRVLIGAFANFSALCRELSAAAAIRILCAGTGDEITREDVLLAGAVTDDLTRGAHGDFDLNDQALLAADTWRAAVRDLAHTSLVERLRASRGGRNLLEIGRARDIEIAATIDRFNVVPELDTAQWRIRAATAPTCLPRKDLDG